MQYPINEIFYSLQGEAHFAGLPSVFIRMQGCNVGCAFCDTKHTWELDVKTQETIAKVVAKQSEHRDNWAYFSITDLFTEIHKYPACRHVVFTGGEPAMYDLREITGKLHELGYTIQIETSGTEELLLSPHTWVTLSPKVDMPGHKEVLPQNIARANEIKMPVGKMADIVKLKELLANNTVNTRLIWLQPLSCKENPTRLCIEQALKNNWRVSTQIHKFINIH